MSALALTARNPMRVPLLSVLFFEVVVFALAIPVMILVSHVSPLPAAASMAGVNATKLRRSACFMSGARPPPLPVMTVGCWPLHFCTEKWMMGKFAAPRIPSAAANFRSPSPSPAKPRSTKYAT